MSAVRLGALDGLQRGILSLRANWELILLVWLQTILIAALGALSLLPFGLVLELRAPAPDFDPEEGAAWLLDSLTRIVEGAGTPAFWLAFAAATAIGVAALICYSFFQAGVVGVFAAADRQAPPGRPTQAAWFRTYSWAEFQGRGGRHLWRFFWLFILVLLFWLIWSLLATLALAAVGVVGGSAGVPAGFAVGCAAFLPLLFLVVVLFYWMLFAQAVVADRERGAWQGMRIGLRLLVRRLGAVTLLFVVMVVAGVSMGMLFLVVSLPLGVGLAPSGVELALTIVLQLLQWLVSAVLQLVLLGAVVAIVRSEQAVQAEGGGLPSA